MCTYETQRISLTGSAKGADGWFRATDATIYFDHPVHFGAGHALMVDVINPALGASSRVGLELNPDSARELAMAILHSLDNLPEGLL
jgi:Family of unknown function (DUF6295)